jgi:K+ transporter
LVTLGDVVYFSSNTYKIPHGGYWSLILPTIPFVVIVIFTSGERRLYRSLRPLKLEHVLEKFNPWIEIALFLALVVAGLVFQAKTMSGEHRAQ